MKKKKALFFTKFLPPKIGGVPNYYFNILLNLKKTEAIVLTESLENSHFYDKQLEENGMTIIRGKFYPDHLSLSYNISFFWFFLKNLFKSIAIVYFNKIDFILVGQAQFFSMAISFILKKIFKIPYCVFFHGEEIPQEGRKIIGFIRYFSVNADIIFCNSLFTRERLKQIIGENSLSADKIRIVYPGLDDKFFAKVDHKPVLKKKKELNIENKKIIYTIARLDKRKGHIRVIESLPEIIKKHPDVFYLIGGIGDEDIAIRNRIKELELENYVKITGFIEEKYLTLYHSLGDIFVMPNYELKHGDTEGFGTVFIEANAVGKLVIGGKYGGVSEAIEDNKTGFLVEYPDNAEFVEKTCFLLENKEQYCKMSAYAEKRAFKSFRWIEITAEFEEFIAPLNH